MSENKEKVLVFEGAGWKEAAHNGVGNCRIRTKILNRNGEIIYFEAIGHELNNFVGHVSHCFNMKDEMTNHTPKLAYIENLKFKYTPEDIIKFVNENLNCDFNKLYVVNDGSVRVFDDSVDYLCRCDQ